MASINITGTIVDGSSQAWAQAIITASLQGFANPQGLPRDLATNTPVELVYQTVAADNGSFTLAVESNATIGIPNTGYLIAIQPNASVPPTVICVQNKFTANTDISTLINGIIKHPTFDCLPYQRAYSTSDVLGPFQGALCVQTGAGVTAGYTLWTYDGAAWVELGGGGGGGGITGLNGDVLAGVSPFTASTAVMVHAFDQSGVTPPAQNSTFQIDTQVPGFPSAATPSVGLYAENTFGGTGTFGRLEIYYDNDNLETWALHFANQISSEEENCYIYCQSQMSFINDLSGTGGQSQFKFGNVYGDTGQMLGIYMLNQNPNSIMQIRSEGSDPSAFLVLGASTNIIQLEGQQVYAAPGISFDSTASGPLQTNIWGGVVAGVITSQSVAGFQWETNTGAGDFSGLMTIEKNIPGPPPGGPWAGWSVGFDGSGVQFTVANASANAVPFLQAKIDSGGNPTIFFPGASTQLGAGVTVASASTINIASGGLAYITGTTTIETIHYNGTTPTDGQEIAFIFLGAAPLGNTGNIKTTGFTPAANSLHFGVYSVTQGGWYIN